MRFDQDGAGTRGVRDRGRIVLGSGPVFVRYVVVVRLWGASRAAFTFVLIPLVAVLLSSWIDDEPIGAALLLGGPLVLAGVYVGALRTAR